MPKRFQLPETINVTTRRRSSRLGTQPLYFVKSRTDADLLIDMLREDEPNSSYGIREIVKGTINVQLY